MSTSALSLHMCSDGCARPPYTIKRSPARFIGSPANTLQCSAAKMGRPLRRLSRLAIAANSLPAGKFNGLNVPCAHQKFGSDFGITYWGYDSNGSLKYDVGIRPGKGNEPSSLDFYSDVIGKMTGVEGNKGNVLRFYLFFDGRSAPTFDAHVNSRDSVIGLSDEFKEDFFALCKLAKDKEVKLIPVLWSFEALDMKSARPGKTQSQANHRYLFEAAAGSPSGQCCDTFVSVLKPLVSECEDKYPGLVLAWDIFNEPEWGMDTCPEHAHTFNGTDLYIDWVSTKGMQTFVAKCAVGIHEAGSRATLGSASMRYNWEKADAHTPDGSVAYWSDKAFQNLTHDASKAYLDFYQIHYYPTLYQPTTECYNPSKVSVATFVSSGKTVLVGEVAAYKTEAHDAQSIVDNGYYGVLFWAFEGGDYGKWDGIFQAAAHGNPGFNKFPRV